MKAQNYKIQQKGLKLSFIINYYHEILLTFIIDPCKFF
jgi:hypothetical protein